ncbi:hypothetical protein LCGC14_1293250 [marine sediment metagenome]|uniref:Uncharacterized protein n=1 Tax=marine sediment metagenome TaxID=412755 RepID=A0A0F9NUQ5_9ZZZZ
MTIQEIEKNQGKSFKGTFKSAMMNGYDLHTHYVIVDWKFYHELLKKEKDAKSQNTAPKGDKQ